MSAFPFASWRIRKDIEGHHRWAEHCLKLPGNDPWHKKKYNSKKPWKNDEGCCQLDRLETKALKFLYRGKQCGKALFGYYVLGTVEYETVAYQCLKLVRKFEKVRKKDEEIVLKTFKKDNV